MKKTRLLILILLQAFCLTCFAQGPDVPVGKTDRAELDEFAWFQVGYEKYEPQKKHVNKIKKNIDDFEIIAFGGSWCPDTQRLLPSFYKVLAEAGYPEDKIELYLLDFRKNSPEGEEQNYSISYIPTFIIKKGGEEIGRITERVDKSPEADLLEILQNN